MKVRGSHTITGELILKKDEAIEGKILYMGADGVVVFQDIFVSPAENRIYDKKGSLVFDTAASPAILYFSIIANADGSILSDSTQWSPLSGGAGGGTGTGIDPTGLEKIVEGPISTYNGAIGVNPFSFSIAQGDGDVSANFPLESVVFFGSLSTHVGGATFDGTNTIVTVKDVIPIGSTSIQYYSGGTNSGWRLIGRNPNNYGSIGYGAVDLSYSNIQSSIFGALGKNSLAVGSNVGVKDANSFVIGVDVIKDDSITDGNGNIFFGELVRNRGHIWNSILGGFKNVFGIAESPYTTSVLYETICIGHNLVVKAGRGSAIFGQGMESSSSAVLIAGVANRDLTQTMSNYLTADFNNYNPRFIIGVGNWDPASNTGVRKNGFVIMSDGVLSAPELSIDKIDNPTIPNNASTYFKERVLVTKEYLASKASSNIGTTIDLSSPFGTFKTDVVNNSIAYINSNTSVLGGSETRLINTPTQPTVRSSEIITAGNFVIGKAYEIKTVGTTDFTLYGSASNTVGEIFTATAVGAGTGEAYKMAIQIGGDSWQANTNMYLHFLKGSSDVEYKFEGFRQNLKPETKPNTDTTVELSNPNTIFKTDVANNATSYILGATIAIGGYEMRLINAATEPTVIGATKIKGSDFVANTDMYLVTRNQGTRNEYHFQDI